MKVTDPLGATVEVTHTWFGEPCLCVEVDDGLEIVNVHLPLPEAKAMLAAVAWGIARAEGKRAADIAPVVLVQ